MLKALLIKELKLVWRDPFALLVLFIMPVVFVVIMALSLQDVFKTESVATSKNLKVFISFDTDLNQAWRQSFADIEGFQLEVVENNQQVKQQVVAGDNLAWLHIKAGIVPALRDEKDLVNQVEIFYAPTAPAYLQPLLQAAVMQKLVAIKFALEQAKQAPAMGIEQPDLVDFSQLIKHQTLNNQQQTQPSSVQQSVPAWLVFAMFFIVIPLSSTLIIELQQGTLMRLYTLPIGGFYILLAKIIPYSLINILQAILMFLAGIYLVPLLGGEALKLGNQAWLLLPTLIFVSFAAISFALLISSLAKTHEQATTLGGLSNLVMGAIGGVMVPTFVMPDAMKVLAGFSPMNWGLEAFLGILIRDASWQNIYHLWLYLCAFAVIVLLIATNFLQYKVRQSA